MINGVLFWKKYNKVLLICLEKDDAEHILTRLHDGLTGGHFSRETTAYKVFREGYYCPTLFKDAHAHGCTCQICEVNVGRERRSTFPLHPVTIENPFEQLGLDVVGQINLKSSKLHKYILIASDTFLNGLKQSLLK